MKIVVSIRALLILLLFPIISFGFTLSVTLTNETCPGNGSLSFTVSNADPTGTIVFFVYKLPDITTPYASGPDNVLNGLTAGDYRIIARETVGSVTTSQQMDIKITSLFKPLTYTIQSVKDACSNRSTVTVITNTGTAATYAIISGPATFPEQASNTFTGLAAGIYRFRVTDICGNSVVQAFTVTVNPTVLTTTNPHFTDPTPSSCNFVVANNTVVASTGTVIAYPLNIQYILYLPGGSSTINVVLNSGNPTSQDISQTIPYDVNNDYLYSVTLTDACGTTFPATNFIVNNDISIESDVIPLPCNQYYFTLKIKNSSGPYSLQFTTMPAGFNPTAFNGSYPGPLSLPTVDFGSLTNPVPFGDYEVSITDTCGKTDSVKFTVEDAPPVVSAIGASNGCLSNDGQITVSGNSKVVAAVVTAAPAGYPFPLPHNVSGSIDSAGILNLNPVPQGDYTLRVTDDCGDIYDPLNVTVPAYENQGIQVDVLQGCGTGRASIKITGNNGKLTSVRITAAPAGFTFTLPYDISNNIVATGELYLTDLPSGNYTFTAVDGCNFTSSKSAVIDGYTITTSSFSLVADCGVFNIPLEFLSNASTAETFGLQKLLDADAGIWGNPITEAVYVDGTAPNGTNSYMLENHATNFNLTFNGVFRIVHHFVSYNNGSDINAGLVPSEAKSCIEILSPTLSFANALAINDVFRIPCSSTGNFDVLLNTTGPPPLHYRITEKDGIPFIVDNGTSNVFLNITPGIYKFEVEDSCGNTVNRTFDVSDLTSLVTIYPVCDMLYCTSTITGNETFDLSAQSPIILGDQSTADYTLSYYTSQANADSNTNPISNLTAFNPTTNPQTIYIRLIFNQLPNCFQTGTFDLITGQNPRVNLLTDYVVCDSQPIQLDASGGNLPTTTYSWSNGANTPAITISDIGTTTVNVTATNVYATCNTTSLSCSTTKEITVNLVDIPEIDRIDTADWTDNENSITIITTHQGAFEYSLDGTNFQDSPTFLHLLPGLYTVYVRDTGGCRIVTAEIWLLNYPKFFTPNGDGYNETWYVKNSENEPEFKVYIYDRYGKLITSIVSNGPGWDGKLNGRVLFADDYWFTAYRQDGRILKGHFTLKR